MELSTSAIFVLFLAIILPLFGQRIGVSDGEGLKAQLLANLNKYSFAKSYHHQQRDNEGPLEPIGGSGKREQKENLHGTSILATPANASTSTTLFPGLPDLFSLFRPPPPPASPSAVPPPPPLPPLVFPTPFAPPLLDFRLTTTPPDVRFITDKSSERRRQPEMLPIPQQSPPHSFPITAQKYITTKETINNNNKWSRTADLIGEWRKRIYKAFKSVRRKQNSLEKLGSNQKLSGTTTQRQPSFLVFGPPPHSLIDARKANKIARLFGVEGIRRNRTIGADEDDGAPKKKNLDSSEPGKAGLPADRRKLVQHDITTAEVITTEGEQLENGVANGEDDGPPAAGGDEPEPTEEHFEIVYVPALKRKIPISLTKPAKTWSDNREQEQTVPSTTSMTTTAALTPSSTSSTTIPFTTTTAPSLLFMPSSVTPIVPIPQFPTLLPPLRLAPFTLLPTPSSPSPHSSPESDYLRELENVPEDYIDEQQQQQAHRLPCFGDPQLTASLPATDLQRSRQSACKNAVERASLVPTSNRGSNQFYEDEEQEMAASNSLWDENREMCNSARLRALIEQNILPNNAEQSKRRLQMRAEQQFGGAFYNVICGTGFFSYIAHTDEFCLVTVQNMNCYVFSPVCSTQLSLASGIAKNSALIRHQQNKQMSTDHRHQSYYSARHRKAYLNRN